MAINDKKLSKLELLDLLEEKRRRALVAKPKYVPNSGQLPIHQSNKLVRAVFAGNGSGKCQKIDDLVLMADGSRKEIQHVVPGDYVMSPTGPTEVLGTGRGTALMYEVAPMDNSGIPYGCNDEHILSLQYCSADGRYGLKKGQVVNVPIKEYLGWAKRKRRLFYGWRSKVDWHTKPVPIPPYIFGIWLGDGHSDATAITNMDFEIIKEWAEYCDTFGGKIRIRSENTGRASTYKYSNSGDNQILAKLRSVGVLNNKHIPACYLVNDEKVRLELLAGLLDTDGYLDKRHTGKSRSGTSFEIIQKRKQLSDDIAFLARSLGFKAKQTIKIINKVPYYRVMIYGEIWRIPTKVEHKKAPHLSLQREHHRYRIKITEKGIGEYAGIVLGGDHLYLLGDTTVTHNTAAAVNEALWALSGYNPVLKTKTPVPARVVVVLDRPDKVAEVWLPELNKWTHIEPTQLHKRGKPFVSRISWPNGSELLFMTHDQDELAFESIELDFCITDEPVPRHIYIALRRGGRKKSGKARFLLVGTPIAGAWLRRELYEPWAKGELPDVECFRTSTKVNEANLAEGYIESFSRVLSEKERRMRLEGEFFDLDGLALGHLFKRDKHLLSAEEVDWQPEWPCVVGIDPHPQKDHIAVLLGCTPHGDFIYLKELSSGVPPTIFAKELLSWMSGFRVVDIVCDSLGSGKLTGGEGNKSFIQVLNDNGVRARATSWEDKQDAAWLSKIQDLLALPLMSDNFGRQVPKLRIVDTCRGIISNIETVQWTKYRTLDEYKPKLDISDKDYLAALKYALASNLRFDKGRDKVVHRVKSPYGINVAKPKIKSLNSAMKKYLSTYRRDR